MSITIFVEFLGKTEVADVNYEDNIYDKIGEKIKISPKVIECLHLGILLERDIPLCESMITDTDNIIRVIPSRKFELYSRASRFGICLDYNDDTVSANNLFDALIEKKFEYEQYVILLEIMDILKQHYRRQKEEDSDGGEDSDGDGEDSDKVLDEKIDVMQTLMFEFVIMDLGVAISAISKYIDINDKNEEGSSPLKVSIIRNCQNSFSELINLEADISDKELLSLAAKVENEHFAKELIARGAEGIEKAFEIALEYKRFDTCLILDRPRCNVNQFLVFACQDGNLTMIQKMIDNGADINYNNGSPLTQAITNKRVEIAQKLIELGARTDNILALASGNGRIDIVKSLFKNGISFTKDALSAAIENCQHDIIKYFINSDLVTDATGVNIAPFIRIGKRDEIEYLIDKGANIDAKYMGMTPLYIAIDHSVWSIPELLMKKGAKLDEKSTSNGATALMLASGLNRQIEVRDLLKYGADIDVRDAKGDTALIYALRSYKEAVAKILLDAGANPNLFEEVSPFCLSVKAGYTDIMKDLIRKGVDINCTLPGTDSALHMAIDKHDRDAVMELLKIGADPNIHGRNNRLCLLSVICESYWPGSLGVFKELIKAGAKTDIRNTERRTLLHIALNNERREIVNYLMDEGLVDAKSRDKYGYTVLLYAIENKYRETIDKLLEMGADPNATNEKGRCAISIAIDNGDEESYKKLIAAGAEIGVDNDFLHKAFDKEMNYVAQDLLTRGADIDRTDRYGNTPLVRSIMNRKISVARKILEHNPNIDTINSDGDNAIMLAINKDFDKKFILELIERSVKPFVGDMQIYDPKVLEALVLKDAIDVNKTINGETVLIIATRRGDPMTVDKLLEMGADKELRDSFGFDALSYAFAYDDREIYEELTKPR